MHRAAFVVLAVVVAAGTVHASSGRPMGLYPLATPTAPMPMLDSKVEVTVRGPIVETVVTQRFVNRSDRATEATYIFPLPHDAAVTAMSIQHGARTIRAAIEPREEAQKRYEAAVRAGVAAAVLDQERPDVFTQTVSAVPPKGTVEITLRYDTLARYADGTWSLVLPMVVAPRYVPGTVSGRPTTGTGRTPDTDRVPDASRVTPPASPGGGGPTTVAIEFADPVREVTSPTHELTAAATRATFTDARTDHDAVIRWRSSSAAGGWVEQGADGGYAAVVVEAAPAPARKKAVRLTVVLDRAATMHGDASAVSLPVVRALIGGMTPADRVSLTGSEQLAWSSPADALRVIESATRRAGPFDLTRVLAAAKPEGAPMLLVSDGLVADDRAAIAAAQKLRVPIHVIAVGAAPSRGLLVQIAAITGGTIRFALPSDDLNALAKATLADASTPPPPLTVSWGTLVASDVVPAVLPRLGAGQAMLVLARVKKAQPANARARGDLFAIEALAAPRALGGVVSPQGPLARRWGRIKLDELLVGREDARAVTKHALAFGLVSPYTSLVAIGSEVVVQGGVKHSVSVPVSVPAGMRWDAVREETAPEMGGETEVSKLETTTAIKPTTPVVDAKPKTEAEKGGLFDRNKNARTKDTRRDLEATPSTEADGLDAPRAAPSPDVAAAGSARGYDQEDDSAEISTMDASQRTLPSRGARFSLALGGGLAIQDAARAPMAALSGRIDIGRSRNLVGVEGSLWLVDGLRAQGRFLFEYTRVGVARWFELGLGVGLHGGGSGVGPAGALVLRGHLPPQPQLSGYLRFDGALLRSDETRQGQSALTLGVEWGF